MPQYQVIRSQAIAPIRVDNIKYSFTISGFITPFPIVFATLTPKPKAATKLKNAAHATANFGERTLVETTVAIEFAESWKPLRKGFYICNKCAKMLGLVKKNGKQKKPLEKKTKAQKQTK